jgi:hypothetical protein
MGKKSLPKWVDVLRGILSFVTAIAIILIAFVSVLTWTVIQKTLALATYDRILADTHFTERSHGMVANWIITSGLQAVSNSSPLYLSAVTMQDWESVAEVVLPQEWYADALREILTAVLDWFRGDGLEDPGVQIDLIPVKEVLNGPNGSLAILPLMKDIPDCSDGDVVVITKYGPSGLLSCWPADKSLTAPAAEIAQDTARLLTDQISLSSMIAQGYLPQTTLESLRRAQAMLKQAQRWNTRMMWVGLLLLILYGGLNSLTLQRLLNSLLFPLYGTAGLILLFTALVYALSEWSLGPVLAGLLAGVPIETQSLLLDGLGSLSAILEKAWIVFGVATLALGILVHAASTLFKALRNRPKKAAPVQASSYLRIKKSVR